MNISKTAQIWLDYHRAHSKNNTVKAYSWTMGKFCEEYGDADLLDLTVDGDDFTIGGLSRRKDLKKDTFTHE
jgi:hypothetical protein